MKYRSASLKFPPRYNACPHLSIYVLMPIALLGDIIDDLDPLDFEDGNGVEVGLSLFTATDAETTC